MRTRRIIRAACLAGMVAASLSAAPARACYTASGERALIHGALPNPLPNDSIVVEVDILPVDERALYRQGIVARVRRAIQGDVPGGILILRWPNPSSCDRPFDNGRSGYMIAVARGQTAAGPPVEGPGLLVEPFPSQRAEGFRMRDGATIPPEWRRQPPGW